MKRVYIVAIVVFISTLATNLHADGPIVVKRPEQIHWLKVEPGVSMAVIWGDPDRSAYSSLMRFESGASIPWHKHQAEMRIVVVKGALEVTTDNGSTRVEPGAYLIIPPRAAHTYRCADAECTFVMEQSDRLQTTMLLQRANR